MRRELAGNFVHFCPDRYDSFRALPDWARETLRNLQRIWSRPVHLSTVVEEKRKILSFDDGERLFTHTVSPPWLPFP